MFTVKEVSEIAGISIRALHHYDSIGLLRPSRITEAGYRLYDEGSLEKLRTILILRELEFSLSEIKSIIENPDFDKQKALEQHISLLRLKKERLERIITFAETIKKKGVDIMDFSAFDNNEFEKYSAEAKEKWGKTEAFKEFENKNADRSKTENNILGGEMADIFRKLGEIKESSPCCEKAQDLVRSLQEFITEHYYSCTDEILSGLGKMYIADSRFSENIDKAGGAGTAEFAAKAIEIYCKK